jgi:hypothetical protein
MKLLIMQVSLYSSHVSSLGQNIRLRNVFSNIAMHVRSEVLTAVTVTNIFSILWGFDAV